MGKCIKCNKEMDGKFCVICGEKLVYETKIDSREEKSSNEELGKILNTIKQEEYSNKRIEEKNLKEKQNDFLSIVVVMAIVIIILIVWGIIKKNEYDNEIDRLENQIELLNESYRELNEEKNGDLAEQIINSVKAEFLDENIVFVLDGYGDYYYTYEQMREVTQGKEYTYWAYNIENAKYLGYRAWK